MKNENNIRNYINRYFIERENYKHECGKDKSEKVLILDDVDESPHSYNSKTDVTGSDISREDKSEHIGTVRTCFGCVEASMLDVSDYH